MVVLAAAATIFILLMIVLAVSPLTLEVTGAPPTRFLWIFGPPVVLLLTLGFQFLRTLRRIVVSVGDGDPFTTANADRLRAMTWIALAIQAISIGAILLSVYFGGRKSEIDASMGAVTGTLMALILFILARVFRVGTEMRSELEGTV